MSVMRNASRIAAVLLMATAVGACGGGGGGKSGTAPPVTPTTPPPPPPPPPPPLPTADPASGFTFQFRQYSQPTGLNELAKIYQKVGTGDFNGDGRDDIVAILELNELQVFLQKADGTFAAPWVFKTAINYSWKRLLLIADFNNDGADDIVFDFTKGDFGASVMGIVTSSPGQESALTMRELPSMKTYWASGEGPNAYLPLDWNGDGNVDLVEFHNWKSAEANAATCIPNESCPHIVLYPGDGRGAVGAPQFLAWTGAPQADAREFFVQDIDMDGRDDVVFKSLFGYQGQSQLYYMKRNANGSVSNPRMILDMKGVDVPVFFGDLNSDGRTDVIYADGVHFRNVDGTFGGLELLALYNNMDAYWNVLGDFDGNGQVDVVNRQFQRSMTIPYFVTYLQKNGTLQAPFFRYDPPTDHTVNPAKWDRQAFATGDFNSDGCRDIAVANGYDGILFLEGRNCVPAPR